ncbi:HEPN domain-containing protein [Fundicoccus culcitae]|uniref:HEPN domain-containing protein n=1 Tax=Fundicoccus culcitae TaxID=2969821 RepID=A0ABY5P8X6_9LACT|nr:HEPN domain-containing protein [Fundicoccus culcitae]UUX35216.1 HEPN domain-containing protein [Fundicoccus culcitae]
MEKILFKDVDTELEQIKIWINKNKFDKKTKYLISYSTIRACGVIEQCYKKIIHDYLSENAKSDTIGYLQKKIIDSSDNPKTGNIEKLLSEVNSQFCEDFKSKIQAHEKSDLNSLVQNRNDFAHGRDIKISINTVIKYFESSKNIINYLEEVLS